MPVLPPPATQRGELIKMAVDAFQVAASDDVEEVLAARRPSEYNDAILYLCTTCLDRWRQCVACVLTNLLMLWPARNDCRLVLVSWGEDEEGLRELCSIAAPFLEEGVLLLWSGGETGARLCPPGPPTDPVAAVPAGVEVLLDVGPARRLWHASVCKNTAHLAALQHARLREPDRPPLLANVDCDNLITREWLIEVFDALCGSRFVPNPFSRGKTSAAVPRVRNGVFSTGNNDADCTGRIALQGDVWLMLRGYDEQGLFGSGYQDVDLRNRLVAAAREPGLTHAAVPGVSEVAAVPASSAYLPPKPLKLRSQVGVAIANSAVSRKEDRGEAKIRNVETGGATRLTWTQMNGVNGRICQQRLRNKEVVRNVGHTIGSWAVAVLPSTLAELPSAAVPGEAASSAGAARRPVVPGGRPKASNSPPPRGSAPASGASGSGSKAPPATRAAPKAAAGQAVRRPLTTQLLPALPPGTRRVSVHLVSLGLAEVGNLRWNYATSAAHVLPIMCCPSHM